MSGAASAVAPADRVSFFEEQRRNRRRAWRIGALCALTVTGMGAAVSTVLAPLAALALHGAREIVVALHDGSVPPGHWFLALWDTVAVLGDPANAARAEITAAVAILLLPGALLTAFAWFASRALFLRCGPAALRALVESRPPRDGDFEEMQLRNVVAELALAAGIRPPELLLTDAPLANVAGAGESPDRSVVIVPRALLDRIDREETAGILAHAVASIGNGDARIAQLTVAVFHAFALVITLLDWPFSSASRSILFRSLRLALPWRRRNLERDGRELSDLVLANLRVTSLGPLFRFVGRVLSIARNDLGKGLAFGILMFAAPFIFVRLAAYSLIYWVTIVLLGPLLAAGWRTRRYLADAAAVQLTRNPTGVARGLLALARWGDAVPRAGWEHLAFAAGPELASARKKGWVSAAEAPAPANSGTGAAALPPLLRRFYPSIWDRIERLRKLGSTVACEGSAPFRWRWIVLGCAGLLAVFAALLALLIHFGSG